MNIEVTPQNTTGIWPPGIEVVEQRRGSPQPLKWRCLTCYDGDDPIEKLKAHGGRGTYSLCARHSVMHVMQAHWPRTWWAFGGVRLTGDEPPVASKDTRNYVYAVQTAYLFTPAVSDRSQPGDLPSTTA